MLGRAHYWFRSQACSCTRSVSWRPGLRRTNLWFGNRHWKHVQRSLLAWRAENEQCAAQAERNASPTRHPDSYQYIEGSPGRGTLMRNQPRRQPAHVRPPNSTPRIVEGSVWATGMATPPIGRRHACSPITLSPRTSMSGLPHGPARPALTQSLEAVRHFNSIGGGFPHEGQVVRRGIIAQVPLIKNVLAEQMHVEGFGFPPDAGVESGHR